MGEVAMKTEGADRAFRRGLMLYGSTAAIAAALMVADGGLSPVFAQSIGPRISPTEAAQGSFSVPGGTPAPFFASRSETLDVVNVLRDAVLNWTPYDSANNTSFVNFLPRDAELRFVHVGEPFTVINRIITADNGAGAYRPLAIQGTISSYLFSNESNTPGPQAGNVWFYSPGGILATGTAAFNVGSLLLSTSDFVNSDNYGNYRVASFSGVADPLAKVSLLPGAQVNLPRPGSSLVIFSPSIDQGGSVTVNGSVSYISAVRADISIPGNGAVFPSIYEESASGNRITHTGTTTGPASIGTQDFSIFDPQTIEFLGSGNVGALLSGSIGYAPATNAMLMPNGSIRLSVGAVEADGNLQFTSSTTINAPGSAKFVAGAGETISGGSDVNGGYSLSVNTPSATFGAESGGTIDFDGGVSFSANNGSISYTLFADGVNGMLPAGSVSVGGDLAMNATTGRSGSGAPIGSAIGTITGGGRISVGGSLRLLADSHATETMAGTSARGGTASLTVTGATSNLTVGGALEISADALPFSPFCECSAPSGFADAGDATFIVDAGTVTAESLLVSADATAHFNLFDIDGRTDFHATAGNAWVDLGNSTANFDSINISANAVGARGVDGLAGGIATGGDVRFAKDSGGSLTTGSLQFAADATGGKGGDITESTNASGMGGMAQGGTVTATLLQSAEGLSLFGMRANGTGGAAGEIVESSGTDGGSGGEGRGGMASLVIGGSGTVLGGISEGVISASGTGGAGGYGTGSNGFDPAGKGGAGGTGRGGALSVEVGTGAEFAIELSLSAGATGGSGGAGGNGAFGEPAIVPPAAGGHGGDVFGGSISLLAAGGTISGQLELDVGGSAGAGGQNGFDAFENDTGEAPFGYATGGAITLETSGASGLFSLGNATLFASADAAGSVALVNGATGSSGGMSFGSLYIDANSSQAPGGQNVTLSSAGKTIRSGGSTDIYGDAIGLDFAGGSGLSGQSVSLGASQGGISLNRTTGTGEAFVSADDSLNLYASGTIDAGPGTRLSGASGSFVRSNGGDVAIANITGGSTLISARGNVELGNADIAGTLNLLGGLEDFDGAVAYHPEGNVTVTGSVSTDVLAVASGGTSRFAAGSAVASNNSIEVRTGDDVIVEAGASLVSNIAPNLGNTISLYAGAINLGGMDGDLVDPILTPIASVVVRGRLDSNGDGIFLTGDAVDATGSTILTGDLLVDVTDVPVFGPLSSDGGLLTAGCFQGSACLGNLSGSGAVSIGLDSADLQTLRIASLFFSGTTFRARTVDTISLGTSGTPSTLNARGGVALTSLSSEIVLTDISISAGSINLSAENGSLIGNGNLSSVNEIVLGIGGSISAGQITTGATIVREPQGATPFVAGGDFIVAGLETGGGSPIAIEAAGNIAIGLADPNGAAITLTGQSVHLDQSSTDTASIALAGTSVQFGALNAVGPVSIGSSVGSIVGSGPGSINAGGAISLNAKTALRTGNLVAGGTVGAVAGSNATLGAITTTAGGVAVTAGNGLVVGSVQTANTSANDDIVLSASGGVTTGIVNSGENIALSGPVTALGNMTARLAISANGGGNFRSLGAGTSIDVSGGPISLAGAAAGTSLRLAATSGGLLATGPLSAGTVASLSAPNGIAIGALTAGGNATLNAGGTLTGTDWTSGGSLSLSGSALTVGNAAGALGLSATLGGAATFASLGSSSGAVSLTAAGNAAGGDITAASTVSLSAAAVMVGDLTAGMGLSVDADSFEGGDLKAGSTIDVVATGAVGLASAKAGGDIILQGRDLDAGELDAQGAAGIAVDGLATIETLSAGEGIELTAGQLVAGTISSGMAIRIVVDAAAEIANAESAGALSVTGATVSLGSASFGSGIALTARTGDVIGTGLYKGTSAVVVQAARDIAIGSVDALGPITLDASRDARFSELRSTDGNVSARAAGAIIGSTVAATGGDPAGEDTVSLIAGGDLTLTGSITALNSRSFAQDDFSAEAGGTLAISGVESRRDLVLKAGAGMLSAANITSGRDLALTAPAVRIDDASVAGNLTVSATGGDITGVGSTTAAGAIALTASGGIAVGNLTANGGGIAADAGASIAFGNLTASGPVMLGAGTGISGSGSIASGGGITLATDSGATALRDIVAAGPTSLSGGGSLTVDDVALSAGALTVSYDGEIVLRNVRSAASISIDGGSGVAFTALDAGTGVDLDVAGAISGGTISAGQAARIEAGAAIGLTGLAAANASIVSAGGPVSASGVAVSGPLDVQGTAVMLAGTGALEVRARATAGTLAITTAGDLRIDGQATGDITLASTGGSVIIGAVAQRMLTDNSNAIGTQALSGGSAIAVSAANGISVSDTLTAAGALGLTAGGLVALDGATTGQTIAVQSGDLAIGANGSLGQASTQRVSLSSTNAVNLGSGATGGFAVDAGEFGRIANSGDLLVTALAGTGTGAGSITVGALSVNAGSGGQIGTSGTFSLTSAGLLDVNNTLSIGQAGSGNTLMLTGDAIDLDYANAALSVLDAASASTGRIAVNGRLITSLSASAAADIVGKTPAEISTRLGRADLTRSIGLFRAGNLTLEGRDAMLIQNSGGNAVDDRRGLTVGSLTVTGAPDGRTLVVLNGVIGTATGNNAAQIVTVSTPIAAESTFNGCLLAAAAECLAVAPLPLDPVFAPGSIVNETSDLIKEEDEEDEIKDGVADGKNDAPPIDTRPIDDPAGRPMLDDPVTGAGNEDLWQPPED